MVYSIFIILGSQPERPGNGEPESLQVRAYHRWPQLCEPGLGANRVRQGEGRKAGPGQGPEGLQPQDADTKTKLAEISEKKTVIESGQRLLEGPTFPLGGMCHQQHRAA